MKRKLLVTASTFPRFMNDTEPRFIYDLSKEMLKYYDVTVLVPDAPGTMKRENMEGLKVIRYPYFPIRKMETLCYPGAIVPRMKEKKVRVLLVPFLFIGLFIALCKEIKKYDMVHAHWIIPQGIVQSFFGKPFIITGLGGDVTSLNKGPLKYLKIKTLKKSKYATAVSKHLLDEMNKIYPMKYSEVISMGCNIDKFSKDYKVNNYFGQGENKVILFVGRLVEKKGACYLIEAMRKIEGAKLIIVGDGPQRVQLQQQAVGMEDKIVFLGAKDKNELIRIYASSDIFCLPSVKAVDGDQDGLPVAMVEAMASSLPVVSTNLGGIAEIVRDGINGYLVEEKNILQLTNRLKSLIESEDVYQKCALEARKTAERFDFKDIAKKYADILEFISGK